ncbi:MAG: CopG family transcriptional regulator [Actinobacteria bacterium]|nr:CopG family transcriptional regulator [Actinomycetota bacterium]
MKRTTIKLPDEVDYALRAEAGRRGMTISELTREAIETFLGIGKPRRFPWAGIGHSGETDISERVEEILREEWSDPYR